MEYLGEEGWSTLGRRVPRKGIAVHTVCRSKAVDLGSQRGGGLGTGRGVRVLREVGVRSGAGVVQGLGLG